MRIGGHPLLDFSGAGKRRFFFTFDGRPVAAREGDTIAAGLLANDILVFGLSPRLGEPRSAFCLRGKCGECLMRVDGEENVRACQTPAREGMVVESSPGPPG